jgi:hypothetical protein
VLVLAERPRVGTAFRPSRLAVAMGAGIALLGASLFLPWQRACYPDADVLAERGTSGPCLTANGWTLGLEGSVGLLAALALAVVVPALALRALSRTELAVALALLVATLAVRLESGTQAGVRLEIAYGVVLGLAAAALLVGLALAPVRVPGLDSSTRATALPGAALGAAYVAVVVLPWWGVLPGDLWSTFASGPARLSWITVAAALVAIRLTGDWVTRLVRHGTGRDTDELVVLPLALVALAGLDALRYGLDDLTWNTAVLGSLATALTLLALVERAGGFARVQVPEVLRVDRI